MRTFAQGYEFNLVLVIRFFKEELPVIGGSFCLHTIY